MSDLKSKISSLANAYYNDAIMIRRHLHKYPELSFQEHQTSNYIQHKLTEYGIPFQAGVVDTGVVALINGVDPQSKCIALRADMDALPIHEQTNASYASKNKGVMHACGHDFHTASLLGVARILNVLKNEWRGSVKLIFQPGEEKLPGGASLMIKEGVLEKPRVDKIIGQHVSPELQSGTIGIKAGKFMASTDEVYIDVIGKGGHAALPEGNINPIVMASDLITKLYDHFAQESDFDNVFSIGAIKGGSTGNIIPDKVRLQGTFRALDMTFRKQAHNNIRHICDEVSKSHRGNCESTIVEGYPVLQNDIDFTKQCANNAKDYMGEDNVLAISKRMTAEDFAYYSHYIPSCFYRIGVGDSQSPRKHLHNAKFDIDESAIRHSMGLMSWLAVNS